MKERLSLIFVLTILLTTLSSAVVINEFVVDPQTDWDSSGSATTSDEWIELFNPSNQTLDLTNWTIIMNDSLTTNASIEILNRTLPQNSYTIILNPEGSMSMDGQIILYNSLGQLVDSVTYGDWDDGNESDNALDGNAESFLDECLARIPNSQDTNVDKNDFMKTECTYGLENKIISPEEQNVIVTIGGKIAFKVLPRWLDFGLVQPGTQNNNATNGPIRFDVNGSTTDVNVEITEVTGYPFDTGLKIDSNPATGSSWLIPYLSPIRTAEPTLDVPSDAQPGPSQGTIVYTVSGIPQ